MGWKLLLAAVPLALIGAGVTAYFWLGGDGKDAGLKSGVTYEVWISEAEVTPARGGGQSWDQDGSAPDLRGVLVWQGQRILDTVTDTDALIAQWQPVGLKLSDVLHGEADAATVRRVGRVRPADGGFLEVGLFDMDPVGSDVVAVFRLPWRILKPGINEIRTDGPLLRLRLVMVEPGAERAVMPVHVVSGAEVLPGATPAMEGTAEGVAREVGKQVDSVKDKAAEKAGNAVDRVKGWLNPDRDKP